MVTVIADEPDLSELRMDGLFDEERGVEYWEVATRQERGEYRCLANVGVLLCLVEIQATPVGESVELVPK